MDIRIFKAHPHFGRFLGARVSFTLGVNMQATLVAWLVYQMSHDALSLGLVGLAEIVPFILMLLFGGAWSDVFNRKRLMTLAMMGFTIVSFGLLYLSWLLSQGAQISLLWIYALIFLTGLARGVLSPAQNALIGQMIPKNAITQASVWNSLVFHMGSVGGPALGGLLYGYLGVDVAFLVVTTFMVLAVMQLLLMEPVESPTQPEIREPIFHRIGVGIHFVGNHKLLLPAMAMDMVAVLFGGAVAVLPVFADQILGVGAVGLGWLRASPAVGSLVMSVVLSWFEPKRGAGVLLLWSVIIFGATNLFFALSTVYWLSFLMLFLGGAFDSISAVIRLAIVQIHTPDAMRGRVSAVNAIFIGSSNELGAFESGVAARLMGLVNSVVFGAMVTFSTVGVTAWKAKEVRELDLSS